MEFSLKRAEPALRSIHAALRYAVVWLNTLIHECRVPWVIVAYASNQSNNENGISASSTSTKAAKFSTFTKVRTTKEDKRGTGKKSALDSVPPAMRINVDPILGRTFVIANVSWSTSVAQQTVLSQYVFPYHLLSNAYISSAFALGALSRYSVCIHVSLTGTLVHQGILLVSAPPFNNAYGGGSNYGPQSVNTLLTAPHVMLGANEATSGCLTVPFYFNAPLMRNYDRYNSPPTSQISGDDGTSALVLYVMNPLQVGSGSSTTISVLIEAEFVELEMFVPRPINPTFISEGLEASSSDADPHPSSCACACCSCESDSLLRQCMVPCVSACFGRFLADFASEGLFDTLAPMASSALDATSGMLKTTAMDLIDMLRATVRKYTGLHNPNKPALPEKMIMATKNNANEVDGQTRLEKLDPYNDWDRIYDDFYFGTDEDEMLISNIINKPQYVGSFQSSVGYSSGMLLWSRPISPCQGFSNTNVSITSNTPFLANNIELIYYYSRMWRGSINIHIQSSMTAKHSTKLLFVKYYAPANAAVGGYPAMNDVANCPKETLEFSAGNQIATVTLPFCSSTRMVYCTRDLLANVVTHGMYYIYQLQPLIVGDNVPTTCQFNVYISLGDDFTFAGYGTDYLQMYSTAPALSLLPPLELPEKKPPPVLPPPKIFSKTVPRPSRKPKISIMKRGSPETTYVGRDFLTVVNHFHLDALEAYKSFLPKKGLCTVDPPSFPVSKPSFVPFTASSLAASLANVGFTSEGGEKDCDPVINDPCASSPLSVPPTVNVGDYDKIARPLVSVRDLVRRFQFCETYQLGFPAYGADLWTFPVSTFLGEDFSIGLVNSMTGMCGMYYGRNVGLKFKLKIVGASNAIIRYLPQSIAFDTTGTGNLTKCVTSGSWNSELGLQTENAVTTGFVTGLPIAEEPQHFTVNPYIHTASGVGLQSNQVATSLYEFVIPNVSIFDYLGSNLRLNSAFNGNDVQNYQATADMGNIMINIPVASSTGVANQAVFVTFYVGLTDESRLGMHSLAPVFQIPTAASYSNSLMGSHQILSVSGEAGVGLGLNAPKWSYWSTLRTTYN